jgi:hypothetical protein
MLTMAEAGYLSGEAALICNSIRESHRAQLHRCAKASRTAMAILGKGVAPTGPLTAALAAWVRSISACQGAILLAERGMVTEACALLRTGYEHMFFAGALVNDPAVLDRMHDQDVFERQKTMRLALADADVGRAITAVQRADLEQALQQEGGDLRISAFDAAKIAGMASLFQTTYRQLSLIGTHANLTSVGACVGNTPTELRFVQAADDLPQLLDHIVGCLEMGSGIFLALQDDHRPTEDAPAHAEQPK